VVGPAEGTVISWYSQHMWRYRCSHGTASSRGDVTCSVPHDVSTAACWTITVATNKDLQGILCRTHGHWDGIPFRYIKFEN